MELKNWRENCFIVAAAECGGTWWFRLGQDSEGVRGGDLDLGLVRELEGLVERFHGGENVCD